MWLRSSILIVFSVNCHAIIRLDNAKWQVDIEPSTLAIRVLPRGEQIVEISRGGQVHSVGGLETTSEQASWQWDQKKWLLTAVLNGPDLTLSIKARGDSNLTVIDQPASASGRALLLPLGQGSYIPTGDQLWRSFLQSKLTTLDTSENLTLPLWGNDYGRFSLHWLLQNPFGNQLTFRDETGALRLTLTHHFSKLSLLQPMEWTLHLGGAGDLLAGAKRYRQWLIARQRWQSLDAKVVQQPAVARLFGASHIYLWGNAPLAVEDVRHWGKWLQRLRDASPLAVEGRQYMDADSKAALQLAASQLNVYQKKELISALNQALEARVRAHWQVSRPDWAALPKRYHEQQAELQAWLGAVLEPDSAAWGGGLSSKLLAAFKRAGLEKLWLGLGEGWEGGLWHADAVQQAVAAGYLVAPYDSYQTGLLPGDNPQWTTAHLGEAVWRDCAVVKQDSNLRAGFQNSGHYLNPICTRPILQQRITAVHAAVPFNSWFLDAYGTAMAWDDFRPGKLLSSADMIRGYSDNMEWAARQLNLVIGSEGGNAAANRGMVFGHGIGMPVISWLDADFKRQSSLWYFGGWFPQEQPSIFFKSVPLKEPYRRLYHDPVYRLPLYQAVFHDSVITTSHWLYDNMKFSNTQRWDTLTQLLYNMPPLYHLNAATLAQRLPVIQRYDRFFRPLHQQLARQALIGFRWLSSDRRVQQTIFADNSRLTINDSKNIVSVDGQSLAPGSVLAQLPGQAPQRFTVGN